MDRRFKEPQLCESCQNACGQCRWSASGKPVDGWVAYTTRINISSAGEGVYINSYKILRCPKYKKDEKRHTPRIVQDRAMILITHILIQAVRDYARGCVRAQKDGLTQPTDRNSLMTRRWFLSPIAEDMLYACNLDVEPKRIVELIESDPLGVLQRINIEYALGGTEHHQSKIAERKYQNDSNYQENV